MNQVVNKNQDDQNYELLSELVSLRRTAKVVRGGRIFRFSATVVVGDGEGQVGIGIAHGLEVSIAYQKAQKQIVLVSYSLLIPPLKSVLMRINKPV